MPQLRGRDMKSWRRDRGTAAVPFHREQGGARGEERAAREAAETSLEKCIKACSLKEPIIL